ncbi:MAG: HAD-IC family P-type ATPase, partial [Elusimicrobia bacterium]|nr:HAD-IC family P-type ATPase [Elusimicrobiota bacterium]
MVPKWHYLSIKEVTKILDTDIKNGLEQRQVKKRQKEFGLNKLPEEKPLSSIKILLHQFRSPLVYILVIAGFLCLFLKEWADSIVIFAVIFINVIVGFIQERKASNALKELKKAIKQEARVLRQSHIKIIEAEQLVPGDIIVLRAGDKIPADARLIETNELQINEAVLTGEWIPSDKSKEILAKETPLADRDNMVYMGCVVEDGRGKAVVAETGNLTEIGKVAEIVREVKEEKTAYQKRIIHLSKIIGVLIVFISLLIFILGIGTGREIFEMLLTAVAVMVAAIPQGLPVAITVILALGMQRILKRR